MEYRGKIIKVYAQKEGWASVLLAMKDGTTMKAAGYIFNAVVGQDAAIEGEIVSHPVYGEQIKIKKCHIETNKDISGIIAYLSSGLIKGVGDSLARRIVKEFGNNTLQVIENDPEKLKDVNGISNKKLAMIVTSHLKNNTYSILYNRLGGKITPHQAAKIIDKYGSDCIKIIERDPYCLIYTIDGFGFRKADSIAKAAGLPDNSPERVGAAVVYTLKQLSESDGHCYGTCENIQLKTLNLLVESPGFMSSRQISSLLKKADVWEKIKDDYCTRNKFSDDEKKEISMWFIKRNCMVEKIADAIITGADDGRLVIDGADIYCAKLYKAENEAGQMIAELCQERPVKSATDQDILRAVHKVESSEGYMLEQEQIDAAAASLKVRLFVITGGPGRGKSTIIRTIIEAWENEDTVELCAPTGRAAQRMKEVTGRYAETVSRKLQRPPRKGCLLICDEASMLDIELARDLLEWGRMGNIIFVGDADQLPSIGPGSFFEDLVKSKNVPTIKLVKGHRNFGSIEENAEKINTGQPMRSFTIDNAFKFISCDDSRIQDVIINEYLRMRNKYGEKNTVILSPMKDRTGSAVNALNEKIRDLLNPFIAGSPQLSGCKFREGDRVMQTKNIADKEVRYMDGRCGTGIYNGDCGTIERISEDDNELTVAFDDGRAAVYEKHETEELILAYAMTIHKSQGSEYKGVIIALTKGHNIMLRRRLFYTAETRAKNEVECIGEEQAFDNASKNKIAYLLGDLVRNTKLSKRIEENIR